MSSPMVESRGLPNQANDDNVESGFPFDETEDRGQRFESELEDIASRFPEFADQLRRPFTNPEGRRARRTSGSNQDLYDRLLNFRARDGFPFTADFEDDPIFHHTHHPYHQQHHTEEPTTVPDRFEQKVKQNCEKTVPSPEAASCSGGQEERKTPKHPNIQQSNTVDLGQKQEPVDDSRNQRSMSAPPENSAAPNKRFVSSINIPNLHQPQPPDSSAMGGRMSSNQPDPAPKNTTSNKPNERVIFIPIHIEGRDEPIVGKGVPSYRVDTEKTFESRPTYTPFANKEQEQKNKQQQEELQRQQEEYQRQQQELYQRQQEQQQKQQEPPAPKSKPTPLDLIQNIQKDVSNLMSQVEKFEGKPKDKQYIYLDEMLTRNLLKLDNIETEGKDSIRQARKEAIKCIEECIRVLEMKANNNESKETKAEEPKTEEVKEEKEEMEQEAPKEALVVGGVSRSGSNAETKETMEVEESGDAKTEEVKVEEGEGEVKEEVKVEEEKADGASQGEEKKKVKKKSEKK